MTPETELTDYCNAFIQENPYLSKLMSRKLLYVLALIILMIPVILMVIYGLNDVNFALFIAIFMALFYTAEIIGYVSVTKQIKFITKNQLKVDRVVSLMNNCNSLDNKVLIFCGSLLEGAYCTEKPETLSKIKTHLIVYAVLIAVAFIVTFIIMFNNEWLVGFLAGLFGDLPQTVFKIIYYVLLFIPTGISVFVAGLLAPIKSKKLQKWAERFI